MAADFSTIPASAWNAPGQPCVYWRWDVTVPRTVGEQRLSYRFEPSGTVDGLEPDWIDGVAVPPRGELPRAAFFSCNGVSDARRWRDLPDPYALWSKMLEQQQVGGEGFHLLIGGGDQVYADSLWEKPGSELDRLRRLDEAAQTSAAPTAGFQDAITADYVTLYCERWTRDNDSGEMLARVPGLFTWDDHDIFDGWGSHGPTLQQSPYYRQVYLAAARAFEAFQLGGRVQNAAPHYFQAATFGGSNCELDIVVLDLRSGRSSDTVMTPAQWQAFDEWRAAHASTLPDKARHVLLVSSIPLVYMRFPGFVEELTSFSNLRDDLRDQWESVGHRGERARLIMDLLRQTSVGHCAVTVVSGDVHVGARAQIRSRNRAHLVEGGALETLIEQVTSSAIVHPPPSALELLGMRAAAFEGPEDLPGAVRTEIVPLVRGRYLAERNWLAIRLDPPGAEELPGHPRMWLEWRPERRRIETAVVVEAPEARRASGTVSVMAGVG